MEAKKIDVKEIDLFFEELLSKCQHKGCYSVIETAKKMGVTYEEVQKWAESSDNWAYILEWCRTLCRVHTEEAGLLGHLQEKEAFKYLSENSEKYRKLIEEQFS
jgi:hypothetical protein